MGYFFLPEKNASKHKIYIVPTRVIDENIFENNVCYYYIKDCNYYIITLKVVKLNVCVYLIFSFDNLSIQYLIYSNPVTFPFHTILQSQQKLNFLITVRQCEQLQFFTFSYHFLFL